MEYYDSGEISAVREIRKRTKTDIIFFSVCASMAVLGYIISSQLYAKAVSFLGLKRFITGTQIANQSFALVSTMLTLFVPFLIIMAVEKKRTDIDICPLDKPKNPLLTVLSVPAGVSVCIIGSVVTNYITLLFSMGGIQLTQPSLVAPPTGYALFIYVLRLTVVAAVMEEVCFRGAVMQPLRKYGNMFAVVMSAMIFALTHCNLIQAPAAFISGIGMGYFAIATGSVWTSMMIHLLNNTLVALAQYFMATGREDLCNFVSYQVTNVVLIVGLSCLVLFFIIRKSARINGGVSQVLTTKEKLKAYIINPAMIITILVIAYMTSGFIIT